MKKQKKTYERVRIQLSIAVVNCFKYRSKLLEEKFNVNKIPKVKFDAVATIFTKYINEIHQNQKALEINKDNIIVTNYASLILHAMEIDETPEKIESILEIMKNFITEFMHIMMQEMIKNMKSKQSHTFDEKMENMQTEENVTTEEAPELVEVKTE